MIGARYRLEYGPGIFERHRYLAGSDARRFDELWAALADPDIRAVFCARGGYGATRLLSRLSGRAPPGAPKPLIGFSDITALHLWLQAHGRRSIHGPVLTQLGRLAAATAERLFALLESARPAPALVGTATYVAGVAEGALLGGNLSVLSRMLGTPFMPALDGAILLLEDQGERPYRLDRMWTHLQLAGVFARVRGIALGSFTACEEPQRRLHERRGAARAGRRHRAAVRRRLSRSDTAMSMSRCRSGCGCGSMPAPRPSASSKRPWATEGGGVLTAAAAGISVQAPYLQRQQRPALFALDLKLDRAAADLAVLDVGRLVCAVMSTRVSKRSPQ